MSLKAKYHGKRLLDITVFVFGVYVCQGRGAELSRLGLREVTIQIQNEVELVRARFH